MKDFTGYTSNTLTVTQRLQKISCWVRLCAMILRWALSSNCGNASGSSPMQAMKPPISRGLRRVTNFGLIRCVFIAIAHGGLRLLLLRLCLLLALLSALAWLGYPGLNSLFTPFLTDTRRRLYSLTVPWYGSMPGAG